MAETGPLRLRSERIVSRDEVVAGEVAIEDGRITSVGPFPPRPGNSELIELGDRWVVPGFLDGHVHGGGGAQCNTSDADGIAAVARFHARHGTTGLLATTVAAPVEDLRAALKAIGRCQEPNLLGAHLEGPFLSPQRPGAMDPSSFITPDPGLLARLLAAADGGLRVMTLAPELPGALELIGHLKRAGVMPSLGHTDATYAQLQRAAQGGANAVTHLFNAMPPFHHRDPGAVGAALDLPEVSCELICDGVHVDPVAMRLVYRVKGPTGVRLVTDAIAAAGMPDGGYRLGDRPITVSGGRATLTGSQAIAGSLLTMEGAVQRAVAFLGISVPEAVLMASTNPARLLGLHRSKGAIAMGLDADLVVLSELLDVEAVMIAGDWVGSPP